MTTTTDLCPFCKRRQLDDTAVLVNLQGTLTEVCAVCYERAEEAANWGDDDADSD